MRKILSFRKLLNNLLIFSLYLILFLLLSCSKKPFNSPIIDNYHYINNLKTNSKINNTKNNVINIRQANNLANIIHAKHHHTFYCHCAYDYRDKNINLNSCGYKIQKNKKRATRIEWEHIVPVSRFGKKLTCWNNPICCNQKFCYKGRACCQKVDPYFIKVATDLHNIVPEIGELNAIRSNYEFAELDHIQFGQFGACKVKIDSKYKKIAVNGNIKGIIARVYLYMDDAYNLNLSVREKKLFNKWNYKYPPHTWEIDWNNKVSEIQHTNNKYIFEYNKHVKK